MDQPRIFSAIEIGNYVVCPEAWRLKYVVGENYQQDGNIKLAQESRQSWVQSLDLLTQLKAYAKLIYMLLVVVFVIVFLLDLKSELRSRSQEISAAQDNKTSFAENILFTLEDKSKSIPSEILLLLLILGAIIFLWDLFDRKGKALKRQTGIQDSAEIIAVSGSKILPSKEYSSIRLGISSKPNALIKEHGFIIPVDRKPLSKRVQDRNIAHMMAHLMLIEEIEQQTPPYGLLLLGKNEKRSQIKNTAERRRWILSLIDEMQSIIGGIPSVPAPNPQKCRHCDVRKQCEFSAWKE